MRIILICLLLLGGTSGAAALEPHDHIDPAGKFYSDWMRPKGNFAGITHRGTSCCNRTDCFPVVEVNVDRGVMWIRVQYPNGDVSVQYKVDPAIIESNQEDPRESPDARSHACIIGGTVACYVEGGGA